MAKDKGKPDDWRDKPREEFKRGLRKRVEKEAEDRRRRQGNGKKGGRP